MLDEHNSLNWDEAFWEVQSKTMRAYAQTGQYHTIVESHVRLTKAKLTFLLSQSHN